MILFIRIIIKNVINLKYRDLLILLRKDKKVLKDTPIFTKKAADKARITHWLRPLMGEQKFLNRNFNL